MELPSYHKHISEREGAHTWPDGQKDDSKWEDCTWCAGLMLMRLALGPIMPATHAEAEHLRDDAGMTPLGGSNTGDLVRGIKARYHSNVGSVVDSFASLWANLTPGKAAAVQGRLGSFPAGHRLRRFDPGFTGGHDVLVARLDNLDRVWWDDPLAPAGTGYRGEWVTKAELRTFVNGLAGTSLVASILPPAPDTSVEDPMPALTQYLPGYTANVKPSSHVRNAPHIPATLLYTSSTKKEPVTVFGAVTGDVDPANGKNTWYVWWDAGRKTYAYTALDNILDLAAPAGDTSALQEQIDRLTADNGDMHDEIVKQDDAIKALTPKAEKLDQIAALFTLK